TKVYAASTSGKVVKLAESTGTGVWSATVAGVTIAPSLDPASGILAVPTSSGVTALRTADGTSPWSFAAPGATSPMFAAGTMYVGSSNDNFYAVSESTGQQSWSQTTGGAIQDSRALSLSSTRSGSRAVRGSARRPPLLPHPLHRGGATAHQPGRERTRPGHGREHDLRRAHRGDGGGADLRRAGLRLRHQGRPAAPAGRGERHLLRR